MRISNPLLDRQKSKSLTEEDLIQLHHEFMVVYGYLPLEEFKGLLIPTFLGLYQKFHEEYCKKEQVRLGFLKSVCGVKNPK